MIDSLAARSDQAARAAIEKSLSAPDANVRRAAIVALGRSVRSRPWALFARGAGKLG